MESKPKRGCLHLGFFQNQITSIEPLSDLALTSLWISNNDVKDIDAIRSQVQLTTLHMDGNPIEHYKVLSSLPSLIALNISNNQTPLLPGHFENLRKLNRLIAKQIDPTELKPVLAELKSLTHLDLSDSGLSDLSIIEGALDQLRTLTLVNNQISDLSLLANAVNLRTLFLMNNNITDISPLRYLTKLDVLDLSNNPIISDSSVERSISCPPNLPSTTTYAYFMECVKLGMFPYY